MLCLLVVIAVLVGIGVGCSSSARTSSIARHPHRIDPVDCDCADCIIGWSQPLSRYGDPLQFHVLLHEEVQDATGDSDEYGWMEAAVEHCPRRFAEWIAAEIRAKRLLSRHVLQAKAAATVLGSLYDH
jgi:hypothetical protein